MARAALLFALFLLAAMAPAALLAEEPLGLMHHYTEAGKAAQGGDLEEARQHLLAGLKEIPSSPHLRLGLARAHLDLGDTLACRDALASLASTGAVLDLESFPPLSPVAGRPDFAEVKEALLPPKPPEARLSASLEDPHLWTEGIAWDPMTGELLAGSVKKGKLVRVRDGVVSDVGSSARDGLLEIIGLDVDPVRRHLWAVMGRDDSPPGTPHDFGAAPRDNGIVAYDLKTGQRLVHELRPADADTLIHMWNDVSVAPDGTAYFTDMTTGQIWRLNPGSEPEVFHRCVLVDHINGLAVSSDGKRLYVAGLEDVLILDLGSRAARLLEHGPDLCCGLGDGMALRDRHLFIVQNNGLLGERVLHVRLSQDGYSVEDSEALHFRLPEGLMPYTCAIGHGVLHVNGTAPFAEYDEPEAPPVPVVVEIRYGLD